MKPQIIGRVLNAVGAVAPPVADSASYALFRNVRPRSKVSAQERLVHDSATAGFVEVNSKRAATYRWGTSGPTVLLVHGWHSRASRFAAFVPPLVAAGFQVIGFDAPANGDSAGQHTTIVEYQDAVRLLAAEYGPIHGVVCHSFGVLAAVHLLPDLPSPSPSVVAVAGVSEFDYLHSAFSAGIGLNAVRSSRLRHKVGTRLLPAVTDIWTHFDAVHADRSTGSSILAIHSTDDPVASVDQAHRLTAGFGSRARLVLVEGLGHHRILRDTTVVKLTVDFLADRTEHGSIAS